LACLVGATAASATSPEEVVEDTQRRIESSVEALSGTEADAELRVEAERAAVAANHRAIVEQNLPLTDGEATAFWPIYDRYHSEQRSLNDRLVKLVETFGLERDDPEAHRALPMMKEVLAIRRDRIALRSRYLAEFEAALPAPKFLRYFQIENKLQALVDYSLARSVPLAP
jgi:hypothetical protein